MNSTENLKEIINQSPTSAGIYKMLNEKDEILYVGKAKNIQNRLKSYLNGNNLSNRIKRIEKVKGSISHKCLSIF